MTSGIPITDMFPFLAEKTDTREAADGALVLSAVADKEKKSMELKVMFARVETGADIKAAEDRIALEYGLNEVRINAEYQKAEPAKSIQKAPKAAPAQGKTIYGKSIKGDPCSIGALNEDSGNVIVSGEVFSVNSRELQNSGGAVLSFDMTDHTGSVRVKKFFRPEEDKSVTEKIEPDNYVTVRGAVRYDRREDDICIEPTGIAFVEKPIKLDLADKKRVELHLHTRYSAMDALTNPVDAVARAAKWGHPAVAVTDHGVAQAFPEAWDAGKKHGIKVIFGMEGYYVNDTDAVPAVRGNFSFGLDEEFVAFDLETTGLDADRDRITEIGAVILRFGEITDRFCSFVDPGMPIPERITAITGITDADVAGAPGEDEAVRSFLKFAGGRPLVAHNADFDAGHMEKACLRCKTAFDPVVIDTLPLSRTFLPNLKNHKLDTVAGALGLPDTKRHRAESDAETTARMMARFIPMLKENGAKTTDDIEAAIKRVKSTSAQRHVNHIILLVKNKKGLKNLYELISRSHLEHFRKNPVIPKSLLEQYREGLLVGGACESGEVFEAVLRHRSDREIKRIAGFYDYLEIMPVCNNRFLIERGMARDEEEIRDYNRHIVKLAEELNKPVAATGDVHFLDPEEEIYRRIFMAVRKFKDAESELPIYFKTTDEMLEEFSYLGREKAEEVVVSVPQMIADTCENIELFPEKLFTPIIDNSAEDLQKLVRERLAELYGDDPPVLVKKRVEAEMNDIIGYRYDVIYISAARLVERSVKAGYIVGSRGSVGSSAVAFLSGITEVNPLPAHYICKKCKHSDFENGKGYGCGADMPDKNCPVCGVSLKKDGFDIPFETFLGFGGDKVPDIDLNFSGEYQSRAHKHTEELFGRDRVFRAGTVGKMAYKTAFGYVKKYLEERNMTVPKAEEKRLANGCVGVKKTTGQHPGGLVIVPRDMDVTDFFPVQRPADDTSADVITTHFDYHSMEKTLLKLDELGHDDPTMIKMLEDITGIEAGNIALNDPLTKEIFKSPGPLGLPGDDPIIGKTGSLGIPEFGTELTKGMLDDTKPTDFDTLVRLSGFAHGTDVWAGNAKELILSGKADIKKTISCRDDIMLYLIGLGMEEKGAFKIMEDVRRGKGLTRKQEEDMRSLSVPDWYIASCKKIKYLFPKAHAVAYVMMAFRIAWFKVHEPLAFYCAHFYRRCRKDGFDALIMAQGPETAKAKIKEIRQNSNSSAKDDNLLTTLESVYEFYLRGFDFAPVDLYKSDAVKFIIEGDKLRIPFTAVSGLGETAANDIVNCRDEGNRFVSVAEISAACQKVSRPHIDQLRALGAFGDIPESSQMSLF